MPDMTVARWKPQSPCQGCESRFVGCHSSCVKYIDYQQECIVKNKEYKKKRAEVNGSEYTNYIVGVHNERNRKKFKGHLL